ncbi:hypothetical protein [Streptomyces pseudovenezuelae]|nr:hypothetical protein [Streptomyces pseudovenezuelae]
MLNPDRKCTNEPFSLGEKDGNLVMTDGSLILTVELATGRLSYHGPDGQLLFRELSADAVHFERRAPWSILKLRIFLFARFTLAVLPSAAAVKCLRTDVIDVPGRGSAGDFLVAQVPESTVLETCAFLPCL